MDFLKQPATFNIVQLSGVQDMTWLAVASRNKQLCAFQIQLERPVVPKDSKGHVRIAFSMGKFLRIDYSSDQDGTWFVRELMNELEVQDLPDDVERANEIPFMAAIFGYNLHRHDDGGFTNKQAGHWMPTKLTTLRDADEVYMNLNLEEGLGEFASKGSYFGKTFLSEFAKIVLPK
ncbi:MAG: hypothetical protein ABI970_07895 [Chloroflexota bacterium]